MSFTKKYRPSKFSDLIGQDEIKKTLQNILKNQSKVSSFLFFGDRGCGKTSAARIFASAINCDNLENSSFDPCGVCGSCASIQNQKNLDIVEIDAASNNSVENIRSLIENSKYLPQQSKKKIYILDEAHMLSLSAFNALLKILEEPPEYLIFILITTEYKKIPLTVISRCLRLQFKKITRAQIAQFLERICILENIIFEKDALKTISVLSDGAVRDSLSLLESAAILTSKNILQSELPGIFGVLNDKIDLFEIFEKIFENEIEFCFNLASKLIHEGLNVNAFLQDFTSLVSEIIFLKTIYSEFLDDFQEFFQIDFSKFEILSFISKEKIFEIFPKIHHDNQLFKLLEILNQSIKIFSQNIYQNQENFLKITIIKLVFSLDQSRNQAYKLGDNAIKSTKEIEIKKESEQIINKIVEKELKPTTESIHTKQKLELINILRENHELMIADMVLNEKININYNQQIIIDDGLIPSKHLVFILKILRSKFDSKWKIVLKDENDKNQSSFHKEIKEITNINQSNNQNISKAFFKEKKIKSLEEIKKEFFESKFFEIIKKKFKVSNCDIRILK